MRHRILVAGLALMVGLALVLVVIWVWDSPVPLGLKAVSVDRSGMVDGAGVEALLVTLQLTNRANEVIRVSTNQHHVEARVGDYWFTLPDRMRMAGALRSHSKTEELIVMPGGTSGCRLKLNYLEEPLKLQLWRGLGPRSQKTMERVIPKAFFKWLFSAPAPRPEDFKPICLEATIRQDSR